MQPYLILIALYKSYLTHCVVVCFVLFLKINAQFTLKFLGFFRGPVWPTTWAFGPQTNYPNPNPLLLVLYVFLIIFNDSELNFCPKPIISSVISPVFGCCLQTINFRLIFLPQQVIFPKN
jgi:hypothetical protein